VLGKPKHLNLLSELKNGLKTSFEAISTRDFKISDLERTAPTLLLDSLCNNSDWWFAALSESRALGSLRTSRHFKFLPAEVGCSGILLTHWHI
jgi:hypothetical protein